MAESEYRAQWHETDIYYNYAANKIVEKELDDYELINHIFNANWNNIFTIYTNTLSRRILADPIFDSLYVPDLMLLVKKKLIKHKRI